jgi:hypothetical protein
MRTFCIVFAFCAAVALFKASAALAATQATLPATPPTPGWVFPAGTTSAILPARFLPHGEVVVRMTVRGRGLDLLLDTGMSEDRLDSSIFDWLGLGREQSAVLHAVFFGPIQMRELPFVEGSFFRQDEDGALIVGLLGYDFLKEAVVKIDYDHQQVRIIQPAAFKIPTPSMQYPLYPDDTVPMVSATVGQASGGSFIVDTGATAVVVFPRLFLNNRRSFTLEPDMESAQGFQYFKSFWPICGHIDMEPYSVDQMRVETVGIRGWVVWAVPTDTCFSTRRLDGLIGFDFLRLFNVYVDYPQNLVILEPNAAYKSAPNTIKL